MGGLVGLARQRLHIRCMRRHLTSRSKRSYQCTPINPPLLGLLPFTAPCYQTKCSQGSVKTKDPQLEEDGWWRWRGGLWEFIIAISPLLPGAQCRCGGPSPRRHSMVWHALHFSPLTVSSWTSSHANTWATSGFSYLVVGQEYLIIFKKTVRHIIPWLPKYDPLIFFLSSQHFPL